MVRNLQSQYWLMGHQPECEMLEIIAYVPAYRNPVTSLTLLVCDKSLFFLFFLYFWDTFLIPLPLLGGRLPTKRHYSGIPGHSGLLGLPGHYGLFS